MEELIGGVWHRLVTRAADRSHAKAAVTLDEIRKTAGILFRAFGGDPGLELSASPEIRHGARRRFLERLAGSGDRVELAWRDGAALRLPMRVDLFPDRALNRDLYLWLVALTAHEPDDHMPWILRSQQATLDCIRRFPGLAGRYYRLVRNLIPLRHSPTQMPSDEAAQELAIRRALQFPGTVTALPPSRRPFQPVPLWPHPEPPGARNASTSCGDGDQERPSGSRSFSVNNRRKHLADRTGMPDGKNGFLLPFRAESLLSWAEYIKVNRPLDDEQDAANAARAAADLERLTVTRDGAASATKLRFDLDLPPAGADDVVLGEGIPLPEWDWKRRVLQPDYCRLQVMVARDSSPCELPEELRRPARLLRRRFQAFTPAHVWRKAQPDGEDLDLDAWVLHEADRNAGIAAAVRGWYRARNEPSRNLACLLLADLSLSTDAYVSDTARVIDVIRDSLFLFSEALAAAGDDFALYGFSSLRRNQVRFHQLKTFAEPYAAGIRGRIAAIKPGYYTRMGSAIRHAGALLARQGSARKLLLLLTDGKPNDLDRYEGRYGIEDTRAALHEARRLGLRPFCVTIDQDANAYLPHLFGANGFAVIHRSAQLPQALPLLYARLTQ